MKLDEGRAKGGHTKSLHIKLPVDHPIFSLPDGERSRVAREWMDQGRQVLVVMGMIQRELTEIKYALTKQESFKHMNANNPEDVIPNANNKSKDIDNNKINPAIFLDL